MRVFWVVNILFPYPSIQIGRKNSCFGGWLIGLFNEIVKNDDIELGVACTYDGNNLVIFEEKNVKYYLIPNNKQEKMWYSAICDFNPDLIHLHGSEFEYGYIIQKLFPNIKTLVSIQGLVSRISDYYIANIKNSDVIDNITLKSIINGNIYREQKKYINKGKTEIEILKKCTAVIGRTTWDYACVFGIVGKDKYYFCNESLRDLFYNSKWDIDKIEKHSIFVSQAGYPIKGFHIILEAANILKTQYGFLDLKIYVAGSNIIDTSSFMKKIKISSYAKYIKKLISKYDLQDNIIFTGMLNEKEVINKLLLSNVFVQASSIENSSNALGEAMIIGMPCVASNVGGTSDLLKDKEEGFLYPFGDYSLLAYYISKIFNDSKNAAFLGKNARKHALITHNKEKNADCMFNIYKKIFNEK